MLYNICYTYTKFVICRDGSMTAATSKMESFVITVNGFKPLTVITKLSILDVAAVLDPPMICIHYIYTIFMYKHRSLLQQWFEHFGTSSSLFDLNCADELSRSEAVAISRLTVYTIYTPSGLPSKITVFIQCKNNSTEIQIILRVLINKFEDELPPSLNKYSHNKQHRELLVTIRCFPIEASFKLFSNLRH